jgi:hypothetical protein
VARSTPAQAIEAQEAQEMPAQEMPAEAMPPADAAASDLGGEHPVASTTESAPVPAPEVPTGRHVSSSRGRRVGLRRTMVVAGLMAIAALVVRFDGGAKRLVFIGHVAAPAAVAQPAAAPPTLPAGVPAQAPTAKPAAHAHASAVLGEGVGARDGQPARPRRHHHEPLPDEDATLPPTPELSGEGVGDTLTDPPDPGRRARASVPRLP